MVYVQRLLLRTRSSFIRREDGTATVEAVLWLPIFLAVFGLMVDASMIFNGQSKVLRVIQDGNRNMSIGRFTTDAEVETYITTELARFGITPSVIDATSDGNVVLTVVTVQASEMQILGYFNSLLNLDIEVSAAHVLDSADPTSFTSMVPTS